MLKVSDLNNWYVKSGTFIIELHFKAEKIEWLNHIMAKILEYAKLFAHNFVNLWNLSKYFLPLYLDSDNLFVQTGLCF